jgi:hypothetical protein
LLVSAGLCRVELILVAVGWLLWALLVVGCLLLDVVLIGGVVGWRGLRSVAVFRWRT